ncbi:hypothetical protein KHA94_24045 [Bacillus sp. FJAT-49705]|uniref:Uncharacterized protein n=1 Tax=Cytobacillus citreus TaxID=2833586 RepID=A0ABS5NZB6_9BACI|nr:hypothetical protein [Cytobacillus citreus]MBS4193172.1 hypothetical protein [Cytobacillus citreus]
MKSQKYARFYAFLVYLCSSSIHKSFCHKQHFLIAESTTDTILSKKRDQKDFSPDDQGYHVSLSE